MKQSKLYKVWSSMKQRCKNERRKDYSNYGGRGIGVCEEWGSKHGFVAFEQWAKEAGYREGLLIDRINNDGNYEPGNCRWVSAAESSKNMRMTPERKAQMRAALEKAWRAPRSGNFVRQARVNAAKARAARWA